MATIKNRKVWGIEIPFFSETLTNPYINFGEGRYASVTWSDFLTNLSTIKIPIAGQRGGESWKNIKESIKGSNSLGMLSANFITAEFLNIFFKNTYLNIEDKVINFENGSYLIEMTEFIKHSDGPMAYERLRDHLSYTIKFNTNGVTGFSIWEGFKCLEDRIWSLSKAMEDAREMASSRQNTEETNTVVESSLDVQLIENVNKSGTCWSVVLEDGETHHFGKHRYAKEYFDAVANLYNLHFNDVEDEIGVTFKRVIQYARNRIDANPEDNGKFEFDTLKMSLAEAITVIEFYGEKVEISHG